MTKHKPLLLAVAPNGARHSKRDHPALPITPLELATTAVECYEAGARMIHLHVRDNNSLHSLSPLHYQPAIKAVKAALGRQMLIQVTSESAGKYSATEQMQLLLELMPDCLSIALKELIPAEDTRQFQQFIKKINAQGSLIQYILYDEADFERYSRLVESGIIPEQGHSLLLVLGRSSFQHYQNILQRKITPMVCAFGPDSHQILAKAAALGCHLRLGFENGFKLADGQTAKSNADLIRKSRQILCGSERPLANIKQARIIMGLAD